MTTLPQRTVLTISAVRPSPHETVALGRVAALRAFGVPATARVLESWVEDVLDQPWLVVRADDLTLEIVYGIDADLATGRRTVQRLLADRWSVVIRVHRSVIPAATASLGDLPVRVEGWDQI